MIVPPEAPENPVGPDTYRFKRGTKLAVSNCQRTETLADEPREAVTQQHAHITWWLLLHPLVLSPTSQLRLEHYSDPSQQDMPPLPPQVPVPPLSSLDGPFQLAEYLSLKVRADPHNVQALVDAPADITKASERHVVS